MLGDCGFWFDSFPHDEILPLLLLIRLELLLSQEVICRLVRVHKDPQISIARYHGYGLIDLIGVHPEVFPRALHVLGQLLQVVLRKVDLSLIALLDIVEYRTVRGIEEVYCQVKLGEAPFIFAFGDVSFVLELKELLVLDAHVRLVVLLASEGESHRLLVLVLVLLEGVHLVVVVFFCEKHRCPLLMELVPKLGTLLYQLIVRRLVMLVIELKRLDQVSLYHLRLLAYAPDRVIHAPFDVDKSRAHRVHNLLLLLDKVLVKLGVRLRHGSSERVEGTLEGREKGPQRLHLLRSLVRVVGQELERVPEVLPIRETSRHSRV